MPDDWINLSQPLFNEMPRAQAHGDVSFWVDERRTDTTSGPVVTRITHMNMAAHVGTHVDAAIHFVPGGRTIDQYPQEAFTGPGVVLDVRRDGVVALGADELRAGGPEIRAGDIVLLYFGYAERFRDPGYVEHPYLATDAAEWLVDRGVRMVGVDTVTPDLPGEHRPPDFDFPVHMRLLSQDVLIMENLGPGLGRLAGRRVEVTAIPLAIEGGDAAPVVPIARPQPA
jgi:arylformamidase